MTLLGMIGVSLYGAATLPAEQQVPIYFGPGSYNNWVPKSVGLILWPCSRGSSCSAVAADPAGQHLGGRSAPVEDGGDRVERDLEHVVEYERHPLRRGEGVHNDVQREADGIAEESLLSGSLRGSPAASRGSMPTLSSSGCSPRTPRLQSASRQIRLVTVVSQPRRSSMPSPPVRPSRSHASWTASSASACEPSMRNAIAWR